MKDLPRLVVLLLGFCAGFLAALLVAAALSRSAGELERQRDLIGAERDTLEKDRDRLRAELSQTQNASKAKSPPTPAAGPIERDNQAGWGPLASLPGDVGPGTAFQRFVAALTEAKAWNPSSPICIWRESTGLTKVQLDLFIPGEGKIFLNASYRKMDGIAPDLVAQFRTNGITNVAKACDGFCARVHALAIAFGLDGQELQRLDRVAAIVPMFREGSHDKARELLLASLPSRVRESFARKFSEDQFSGAEPPAVRFRLSQRFDLQLAFCGVEFFGDSSLNYNAPGPWWSVWLGQAGAETFNEWPVVTTAEIDSLDK